MTAPQTLASGLAPAQRYAGLGGISGVSLVSHPKRIMAFIAGFPGCGKSVFLSSNPEGFLFNLDKSSFKDPPQAVIWPFFNAAGVLTGDGVSPLNLTYEEVLKQIATLKQLAANNQPRPSTLIFDSLSALIPMMQSWLVRKMGKESWGQIDGRMGWGIIYDTIAALLNDLHTAGYGVIFTAHLVETKIKRSEEFTEILTEINVSDALFNHRLLALFEFVAVCEKQKQIVVEPDPRFPQKNRTVEKDRVVLTDVTPHTSLNKELKCRVDLKGPITLPRTGGWSAFCEAYLSAAGTGVSST